MKRRIGFALTVVALSTALVAPAADAHWGHPGRHRPPVRRANTCVVINRAEDIFATDLARVNRMIRQQVADAYQQGKLAEYWAEAQTCADANLLPIIQGWILYFDPLFVF